MKQKLMYSRIVVFSIFMALLGVPFQTAQADMGPKPTAEFDFVYETSEPLEIVEAALMQCETSECLQAQPLEEMGPQGFSCAQGRCTSMAYGYAEYLYLEITFSDGVTRKSNVLGKEHFNALYQVTVRPDDLLLVETGGQMNETTTILASVVGGACVLGLLLIGGLVLVIVLIVRATRKK